jgi:hypothetical protein
MKYLSERERDSEDIMAYSKKRYIYFSKPRLRYLVRVNIFTPYSLLAGGTKTVELSPLVNFHNHKKK